MFQGIFQLYSSHGIVPKVLASMRRLKKLQKSTYFLQVSLNSLHYYGSTNHEKLTKILKFKILRKYIFRSFYADIPVALVQLAEKPPWIKRDKKGILEISDLVWGQQTELWNLISKISRKHAKIHWWKVEEFTWFRKISRY